MHTDRSRLHPTRADLLFAHWYSKYLTAMHESRLDPTAKDAELYRFTWLRTFHHPVSVRLERQPGGCLVVAKETDGAGGYEPGKLIRTNSRIVSGPSCDAAFTALRRVIWGSSADDEGRGLDGARWLFEGVRNSQYGVRDFWSPSQTGPTAIVRELGVALLGLGEVNVAPSDIY